MPSVIAPKFPSGGRGSFWIGIGAKSDGIASGITKLSTYIERTGNSKIAKTYIKWLLSGCRSSSGSIFAAQFGQSTDKPAVGDYDRDGRSDMAVWRPSTGEWSVLRSSDGFTSYFAVPFGANGDIPIQAAP